MQTVLCSADNRDCAGTHRSSLNTAAALPCPRPAQTVSWLGPIKLNIILPKYEIIGGNLSSSIQMSCCKSLQRFEVSLVSLSGKESAHQCRRLPRSDLIPGSGRSPGGGNGNSVQYSCLQNPMDRGAWQATVHRVTKSWTDHCTHCLSHYQLPFAKPWNTVREDLVFVLRLKIITFRAEP